MQCSNCGQELVAGAEFCGNCGARILAAAQPEQVATAVPISQPQSETPLTQSVIQQPVSAAEPIVQPVAATQTQSNTHPLATAIPKQPHSGLSIAGMVLGILAFLSLLIWLFAIPLGILAIIFSAIGLKKGGKGMAIAGLILGTLGIIATIIVTVILLGSANSCTKDSTDSFCKGYNSSKSVISLIP